MTGTLRERLEGAREQQEVGLRRGDSGRALAVQFSDAIEELVVGQAEAIWSSLPDGASLVAVGGLGRREMAPFGDLDLVLLLDRVTPAGVDTGVRAFVHPLWDLGLRVNLVVHDRDSWLADAHDELSSATAILDARAIVGPDTLVDAVRASSLEQVGSRARRSLLERIDAEVQDRHARFDSTVFVVEPDIKFGPGGLRDFCALRWALQLAYDQADLEGLAADERIPPGMASLLMDGLDTLLRLRAGLQCAARRSQERLAFTYQEALPDLLGRDVTPGDDAALVASIEAVVQEYYRSASAVLRYGARLRERCRGPRVPDEFPPRRIDERFGIVEGRLSHDSRVDFADTPVLALEALQLARDHGVSLRGETADAIAEAVAAGATTGLQSEPEAQRRMLNLLVEPDDPMVPTSLVDAAELGLLESVVPAFGPIRGRMQHDTYHVFTVDQHTLSAIALLKAIARGEHNKDYPLATALHLEIDDASVLYLAMLAHDMGKAQAGDQCETGADIATDVATAAGLSQAEVQRCALLVREHLTMPKLAFRRDLTDPNLIADFAAVVQQRQTLRELYLLSLADTASVRPGNLTSWKLTLFDELYLLTSARLRRRDPGLQRFVPRPGEPVSMPGRYYSLFHQDLRRHHAELMEGMLESGREASLEVTTASGALRLTLVARDRPGLLAHTMAVFDDHGIEVMAADVFTSPGPPPLVLDVFRVVATAGPEHGIDLETIAAAESVLQRGLDQRLLDEAPGPRGPLPLGVRAEPTSIRFEEDAAGRRTIVEVETHAVPDVLRRITRAFAAEGIEILLARFDQEAQRASNVFYVPDLDRSARDSLAARLQSYLS